MLAAFSPGWVVPIVLLGCWPVGPLLIVWGIPALIRSVVHLRKEGSCP